jgi:hypothetical protein
MQYLIQEANIDIVRLKKSILQIVAQELSKLSEPCYYPQLQKTYRELLHNSGLTDAQIKESVSAFYSGTPASKWLLTKDDQRHYLIFLMHYFLIKNDQVGYSATLVLYMIREYSNLMHKQIQFCNPEIFNYVLNRLSPTHLFVREKTISNAIFFLSKEIQKRYTTILLNPEPMTIVKFIMEARTRVSKSIKSFAELYYKYAKEGGAIRTPKETETGDQIEFQTDQKSIKIIETVVKNITVYRQVDKKALEEARQLTKISNKVAIEVITGLSNTKFSDDITLILQLFLKDITNVNRICGKEYYSHVRALMSIKRTISQVYFKKSVTDLLEKDLEEIGLLKRYKGLTSQTRYFLSLFLAYYITLCLKNLVC